MNIELNELGMTFLVGALVILGVDAIRFAVWGTHLTRLSEEVIGNGAAAGGTAVITTGIFIGLSFAAGLLVEDACYKFHDPLLYGPLRTAHRLLDGSDGATSGDLKLDLQRQALFDKLYATPPERTALGDEVCRAELLERSFAKDAAAVARWACGGGPLPTSGKKEDRFHIVDQTIRSAFYFAKNRVYIVPQYSGEMSRIQSRLEFSRTVATLTFGGAALTLLLIPLRAISLRTEPVQLKRRSRNAALLAFAFIVVYVLAYIAYVQESQEYNKRVFGYYAAMIFAADKHVP